LVLFPLFMWLGLWADRRGIAPRLVAASAVLLALLTAGFGTWQPFV